MITVKQLEVGGFDDNFSYLVVDNGSNDAVIIDPCGRTEIIKSAVRSFPELNPKYILLTHGHGDHTSGICEVRRFFNAPVAGHPFCSFKVDTPIKDGGKLDLGEEFIECLYAPGHTKDSVIYRLKDDSAIFTGDTLFIDWCGYCEASAMFNTMRNVIFPLSDSNEVYSGHNYGRKPHSTLGEEKISNPYLSSDNFKGFSEALKNL